MEMFGVEYNTDLQAAIPPTDPEANNIIEVT
jgi:hypothetical protein